MTLRIDHSAKCRLRLMPVAMFAFLFGQAAVEAGTPAGGLLSPVRPVDVAATSITGGAKLTAHPGGWTVWSSAPGPAVLILRPGKAAWDFDDFNHLRIDLRNTGNRLVRIEGSLENEGGLPWTRSLPGSAVVPVSDSGTLGFSFTRPGHAYDGPGVFRAQSAKPNGHRTHWRSFDPSSVREIRLKIHAAGAFELRVAGPALCWPVGGETSVRLEAMPYLDRFGQTRALAWPGKIESEKMLADALGEENLRAGNASAPGLNRFGGWLDGPRLEGRGNFRVEKIDRRWWFVDPEGCLFWSHGVNSVGAGAGTPVTTERHAFFEWLPEKNDPLHAVMLRRPRADGPLHADFLAANHARVWGDSAPGRRRDLDHRRMRDWGLNTLGAWSNSGMIRDRRTVYTLTTGVWWPVLHRDGGHVLPDPFDPAFERALRQALGHLAWARGDAWCLGVFIDNELEWSNDLAPLLFASPKNQPARAAFLDHLASRHAVLDALNSAWGSAFDSWDAIAALEAPPDGLGHPDTFAADMEAFYGAFADRYFATCQHLMRELMPGHLYLGCRIHRAPGPVIRAAIRHVDVYSANRYEVLAAADMLPPDADVPVLLTEFHFGAPDRGVPGTGLRGVHDQKQRGHAYAAYVTGGLLDPRVVGTHWFAWPDQSAAGRPGENYQIGFIDITGRAYPEFTGIVGEMARRIHTLRHNPPASVEQALEMVFPPPTLGK
jgi:hypothetical protein